MAVSADRVFGGIIGRTWLKSELSRRDAALAKLQVQTEGLDNIPTGPCIIVANHTAPVEQWARRGQFPVDAFIIADQLAKAGTPVKTVVQCNPLIERDKTSRILTPVEHIRRAIDHVPTRRAAFQITGRFIPVDTSSSLDTEFMQDVQMAIAAGDSLLMFAEHMHREEHALEHPIPTGAALLALKTGLPILPVYLMGANTWKRGNKVSMTIGTPFETKGKRGKTIANEIVNTLRLLQSHARE